MGGLNGSAYTVGLVGIDGKVVASAQASSPAAVTCADASSAEVPLPVSTSDSRLYFMDAQGVVRFLAPDGDTGRATTVPIGSTRRSMFAVSPDDQRIAVIVDDFTTSGASTRLYVEDLNGGGHHVEPFTESGAYTLWPIGWHGTNNLVVAKVPSCTGLTNAPYPPQELHVVDPTTAIRRFTIGGLTCLLAGPPSPAGALCDARQTYVLNWTATAIRSMKIPTGTEAFLSPEGDRIARETYLGTSIFGSNTFLPHVVICGWIDNSHVLAGTTGRVVDVTNGNTLSVAIQGDCGGRIPGGL